MKPGEIVAVSGWPGTWGQRFVVARQPSAIVVEAFDDARRLRAFPRSACRRVRRVPRWAKPRLEGIKHYAARLDGQALANGSNGEVTEPRGGSKPSGKRRQRGGARR